MALLAGCPTVDLGDSPPDIGLCNPSGGISYFETMIEPQFLKLSDSANSCARSTACHLKSHGLALDPNAPVTTNYRVCQGYLNCGQPHASVLLTKPLAGIDGHGGGDIFTSDSDPAVQTFLMWFQ